MGKNPTSKEKVIAALVDDHTHADSISVNSDISIAYCRQILNDMAEKGEIAKVYGRAHHSYYLVKNLELFSPSDKIYKKKGYCDKFDIELKENIRNEYDRRCFICNAHEDTFAKKLSVHHTDLNKSAGCDDHEWRLVPLCASCHARAHCDPMMSRINYLVLHENTIMVSDYKQIYIEREECDTNECATSNPFQIYKSPTKDRIITAIMEGMLHIDSISLHSDTSEAYCRRVCNKLADDGTIQRIRNTSKHIYIPINGELK